MSYLHIQTMEYPLTKGQIKSRFPTRSFPAAFVPPEGYTAVAPSPPPAYDAMAQRCVEIAPALVDDIWTQQWEVQDLTQEEQDAIQAALAPQAVTMRQARLALLGAGMLSAVDAAIAALDEPAKSAALIAWEYSTEVQRNFGLVSQLAPALGLTDAQIDALFTTAATL